MPQSLGILALLLLLVLVPVGMSAPPASTSHRDLNQTALDTLKLLHNRGADLYNADDPRGCLQVYESAITAIRPFLAHVPKIQKLLDDGVAEASKLTSIKAQAFKLHEVIEQARTALKDELSKKELITQTPKQPIPPPQPKVPDPVTPAPKFTKLSGRVTFEGKPLAGGEVTIVSLEEKEPRVHTATITPDGAYQFPLPLNPGQYVAIFTSKKVQIPERYQTTSTSGIILTLKVGEMNQDIRLGSQ
jgi:hypothetical protein